VNPKVDVTQVARFGFSSSITAAFIWALQFSKPVDTCAPVQDLPEKSKIPLPRNFTLQLSLILIVEYNNSFAIEISGVHALLITMY